ncbi:MAG: hypothetical protein WDO74_34110 [Pseudomonadota bacterium]
MPPAAISRSSTYLPKICGNIARVHVSAAAAFWLLSGCSEAETHEIVLPLAVHTLASCPIPTPAQLDMGALGDFPTSHDTVESLSLTAQNAKLTFPSDTLALQASARSESSDQAFIGFSERGSAGLDFLLWPEGSVCELLRAGSYPAGLGGEALGFGSASGLLLIAGSEGFSSSAVVGALTFDARRGESALVDPRAAMRQPRSFATVTGFGEQLLVAAGEYPIHESGSPAKVFNNTGEVYDPATGSFEVDFVPLAMGVARHAAMVLESGETVLIGGRTETSAASSFIQVVSPLTRTSKLLGTLNVGAQRAHGAASGRWPAVHRGRRRCRGASRGRSRMARCGRELAARPVQRCDLAAAALRPSVRAVAGRRGAGGRWLRRPRAPSR